jgi:hypothetical protein
MSYEEEKRRWPVKAHRDDEVSDQGIRGNEFNSCSVW